jgi:hypothetical protein
MYSLCHRLGGAVPLDRAGRPRPAAGRGQGPLRVRVRLGTREIFPIAICERPVGDGIYGMAIYPQ